MDSMRTVLIVVGAIILAILALKIVTFVTSLLFSLVTIAIVAAIAYGIFLAARSALRGNKAQQS